MTDSDAGESEVRAQFWYVITNLSTSDNDMGSGRIITDDGSFDSSNSSGYDSQAREFSSYNSSTEPQSSRVSKKRSRRDDDQNKKKTKLEDSSSMPSRVPTERIIVRYQKLFRKILGNCLSSEQKFLLECRKRWASKKAVA